MDHHNVIKTITAETINNTKIRGLFLSGSYGNGLADQYSDIDFILVAREGATDAIAQIWREAIERTGDIVLWWDRTTVPVLINAITEDWVRTDVVILKPEQMTAHAQNSLKPLFDHDDIFGGLEKRFQEPMPNLGKAKYQIEEFIRILGLLHLAVGREEYINGVLGVFHLRNLLVELLIDETKAPNQGGVLHLNRLITEEQKELLIGLPPAIPNREAMISAYLAYANAYLPRARKRAQQIGVAWPERFETATWAKLKERLEIERPYVFE